MFLSTNMFQDDSDIGWIIIQWKNIVVAQISIPDLDRGRKKTDYNKKFKIFCVLMTYRKIQAYQQLQKPIYLKVWSVSACKC